MGIAKVFEISMKSVGLLVHVTDQQGFSDPICPYSKYCVRVETAVRLFGMGAFNLTLLFTHHRSSRILFDTVTESVCGHYRSQRSRECPMCWRSLRFKHPDRYCEGARF